MRVFDHQIVMATIFEVYSGKASILADKAEQIA